MYSRKNFSPAEKILLGKSKQMCYDNKEVSQNG